MATSLAFRQIGNRLSTDSDEESRYYCNIEMEPTSTAQHPDMAQYSVSTKRKKTNENVLDLKGPDESGSSECTEETYLAPNTLKQDENDSAQIDTAPQDPSIRLAKTIIEGNEEETQELLKGFCPEEKIIFKTIPKDKLQELISVPENVSEMCFLDLAAHCGQERVLNLLLDLAIESTPNFRELILAHSFIYLGIIFDKLITKSPDIGLDILNSCLDNETTENSFVRFQVKLTPFFKNENTAFGSESQCIREMLDGGRSELLDHPATQLFLFLKWNRLRKFFYLSLIYRIFFAVLLTTGTIFMFAHNETISYWNKVRPLAPFALKWILLATYLPLFFQMLLRIILQLKSFHFNHNQLKNIDKWLLANILECCAFVIFLSVPSNLEAHFHFGAWSVLLSWSIVMIIIGTCPNIFGWLVTTVAGVFLNILTFFTAVTPVLVGFGSAYHILLPSSDVTRSPIGAFFFSLAMMVGHYETLLDSSLISEREIRFHGTTQLIFLIFFFLVTITIFNMSVAIVMVQIKKSLSNMDNFEQVQKCSILIDIEEGFFFFSEAVKKLRFRCLKFHECVTVFKGTEENSFLHCRYIKSVPDNSMSVFHTDFWIRSSHKIKLHKRNLNEDALSGETFEFISEKSIDKIKKIFGDRLQEKTQKAEEKVSVPPKPIGNEYTNLYWQPDYYSTAPSENEYEIVEDNSSKHPPFGILKSMRESLLRELRRDLTKLTKSSENGSAKTTKDDAKDQAQSTSQGTSDSQKFVNVRPGLALGVITLQAGARGPKISLK